MSARNYIFLIVILLTSCSEDTARNVITYKSPRDSFGSPLPVGICRYWLGNGVDQLPFEDSCHFYHMLDTIK